MILKEYTHVPRNVDLFPHECLTSYKVPKFDIDADLIQLGKTINAIH